MITVHNKLVRDNIPEIIKQSGKTANYYVLDQDQYREALKEKLVEEANELLKTTTVEELVEELGDVFEVIVALMSEYKFPDCAIGARQHTKAKEKGTFSKRYFLVSVEDKE